MANRISTARQEQVSPEVYGEFIGQIRLRNLYLRNASVQNIFGADTPDRVSVKISSSADNHINDQGFEALHHYDLEFASDGAIVASISVTFSVEFESVVLLTDEIFDTFSEVNLPVNTWPYLREFVSSSLGRMNWQPFALPALIRGVADKKKATPPRPRRSRKKPVLETSQSDAPPVESGEPT